jgi:predicted transcriptional regulator
MATNKVTFTLDPETVHRIEDAAERLAKPKSQIVREAVADYHGRIDHLSESEIQKRLKIFDTLFPLIPIRPHFTALVPNNHVNALTKAPLHA